MNTRLLAGWSLILAPFQDEYSSRHGEVLIRPVPLTAAPERRLGGHE